MKQKRERRDQRETSAKCYTGGMTEGSKDPSGTQPRGLTLDWRAEDGGCLDSFIYLFYFMTLPFLASSLWAKSRLDSEIKFYLSDASDAVLIDGVNLNLQLTTRLLKCVCVCVVQPM